MTWTAGWNMPGFIPETEPEAFEAWDEALAYLVETIESWGADTYEDWQEAESTLAAFAAIAKDDRGYPFAVFHDDLVMWVDRG